MQKQKPKTVLIADDDRDLVHMLVLRCQQLGLETFRSPDAMHALMGAHRVRPDLVLLDINMPGGNGLSVCEMLTSDEEMSKTPVIIMSGVTNDEITERCKALGVEFIGKDAGFWDRLKPLVCRALNLPPDAPAATGEKNEQIPVETAPEPQPDEPRPRILCIDDDPEISAALKLRLERYGLDVLRAFNGMQGYWTALDMRPDLILLDMMMPEGEGHYILSRLRSHPLTDKVPVLVLTGINTPHIRRKMFGMGVDGFLTKPIDFDSLLHHIQQYVTVREPVETEPEQPAEKPGWIELLGRGRVRSRPLRVDDV